MGKILDVLDNAEHNENMPAAIVQNHLSEPACDVGCMPCERKCAVANIKLSWWLREQEDLLRLRSIDDPVRWQEEIAEAEGRVTQLRQDIERACPAIPLAYPAAFRSTPLPTRLQ